MMNQSNFCESLCNQKENKSPYWTNLMSKDDHQC